MPAYSPAEIHTLFEQAFNLGDVEALTALYEPGGVLVVDHNEVTGRESIRKTFEGLMARRGRMTLETRAVLASHLGLAVLHGGWVIESRTETGSKSRREGLALK
jgi:ketosteroid isomerase-like protein